jgi:hypothetical protein
MKGMGGRLHLLESMYDGRVEFMFIGEVPLEVAVGRECLWAERAAVVSRESTETSVEIEVAGHRCGKVAVVTVEEGEITMVHMHFMG